MRKRQRDRSSPFYFSFPTAVRCPWRSRPHSGWRIPALLAFLEPKPADRDRFARPAFAETWCAAIPRLRERGRAATTIGTRQRWRARLRPAKSFGGVDKRLHDCGNALYEPLAVSVGRPMAWGFGTGRCRVAYRRPLAAICAESSRNLFHRRENHFSMDRFNNKKQKYRRCCTAKASAIRTILGGTWSPRLRAALGEKFTAMLVPAQTEAPSVITDQKSRAATKTNSLPNCRSGSRVRLSAFC